MAKAYISEFSEILMRGPGVAIARMPPVVEQTPVAIGTVASSAVFGAATCFIRVHVDAICSIAIGSDPVATTNNMRLAANQTEYFAVTPGDKISVISNT